MNTPFESWAILELMGHRRLGGKVTEVELFGAKMCRIDIPQPNDTPEFTQYYGGGAIYCMTPCSEETARGIAEMVRSCDYRPQLPPINPHGGNTGNVRDFCECGNEKAPAQTKCWECASEEEVISEPHPKTETNLEPEVKEPPGSIWDGCDDPVDHDEVARCMATEFEATS